MTSLEKPCIAAGLFFLPRKTYANRPPQMNVFCSFVRCLIESAAPVRLEIVQIAKRRGVAPWTRCIRTCRKRNGRSSGLRWATGRAWRRRRPCSPGCRPPPAPERRMTTAPSSPGTPSCATNRAWPRISPTRTARGGAAATRTGTAGDRRRNRQQAHASARLPHPRRGIRRRTARISREQGCCTYK
jgi:hypothetical protein